MGFSLCIGLWPKCVVLGALLLQQKYYLIKQFKLYLPCGMNCQVYHNGKCPWSNALLLICPLYRFPNSIKTKTMQHISIFLSQQVTVEKWKPWVNAICCINFHPLQGTQVYLSNTSFLSHLRATESFMYGNSFKFQRLINTKKYILSRCPQLCFLCYGFYIFKNIKSIIDKEWTQQKQIFWFCFLGLEYKFDW